MDADGEDAVRLPFNKADDTNVCIPALVVAPGDDRLTAERAMTKLFGFLGATIGSYAGWWLGSRAGVMTAFMVGMVGTGLGIYVGRRVARSYEG